MRRNVTRQRNAKRQGHADLSLARKCRTLQDTWASVNRHFLSFSGCSSRPPKMVVFPRVLPMKKGAWLGPESNRRHVDFQSTALPTELPSLCKLRIPRVNRGARSLKQKTHLRPTTARQAPNPQHAFGCRRPRTPAVIPLLCARGAGNGPAKFRYRQIVPDVG